MIKELDRMSDDAYENKKAYNREYARERRKKFDLIVIDITADEKLFKKIKTELYKNDNMTSKEFVIFGYNELKKEK